MKPRLQAELLEQRDCPAAGSRLVQIDSGPAYTLSVNNYGRVAVMTVSQAEFNNFANVAIPGATVAQEATITNRVYQAMPDVFDFFFVTPNIANTTSNLLGYNRTLRSIANGTGQNPIDVGLLYGSSNQLASFQYLADRTQLLGGTGIHEIEHQWSNFLPNVGFALGAGTGAHWGFSDVGGALGGWAPGTLRNLGGNNWTADGPIGNDGWATNDNTTTRGCPYAPLELYLMGLIPASEVPDVTFATNGANLNPTTGDFTASNFQTLTAAQIVATLGNRTPTPFNADRNYRGINLILTVGSLTQAQLDQCDTEAERFSRGGSDGDPNVWNFWEATGGRATVQLGGLNQFIPNGGLVNSFLSVGGDNLRLNGYSVTSPFGYDTNKSVTPSLAEFLGDSPGEVRTVMSDVNGDTIPDFIMATGPGAVTRFAIYNGDLNGGWVVTPHKPFRGSEDFTGGAFVSAGDLDLDGFSEIIVTADTGGGPRVVVYNFRAGNGLQISADFIGIADANFRGGARTAVGDFNGDGFNDLAVVAGTGGGPRTALYNGINLFTTRTKLVNDFFAFPGLDAARLRNGAYLSAGDVNGDGFDDIVFGGGPGGSARVFAVSGFRLTNTSVANALANPLANFFVAANTDDRGGVRVAVKNVDNDGRGDIVVGSGANATSRVRIYRGLSFFSSAAEPSPLQDINPFGSFMPGGVYVG